MDQVLLYSICCGIAIIDFVRRGFVPSFRLPAPPAYQLGDAAGCPVGGLLFFHVEGEHSGVVRLMIPIRVCRVGRRRHHFQEGQTEADL